MIKNKLTPEELDNIKEQEETTKKFLDLVDKVQQFNVGDYLVRRCVNDDNKLDINIYGVAKKFLVVHVDSNKIPYVRQVVKKKAPQPEIESLADPYNINYSDYNDIWEYQMDPAFADSIIMQQDDYDPLKLHKEKANLGREISRYNKGIKFKTGKDEELIKFLQSIKVGDTLWFSAETSFSVEKIIHLPNRKTISDVNFYRKILKGTTDKGKNKEYSPYQLMHRSIYSSCPRSRKELKAI